MTEPSENRTLYEQGKQYARRVKRPLGATWDAKTAVKEIAKGEGEGKKEAGTAYDFMCHVDAIAGVVPEAFELILDGNNPHLTPSIVGEIRAEKKIAIFMERAAAGLHPRAPMPPADWHGERAWWHYDFSRLGQAQALLERVAAAVERSKRTSVALRTNLLVHATAISADLDAVRLALNSETRQGCIAPPRLELRTEPDVVTWVKRARTLIEAVTGDLLRASHTRSLDAARTELGQAANTVVSLAERIRTQVPNTVRAAEAPTVVPNSTRIFDLPGTYAVVLRVKKPGVVRIARLGTFRFPQGYLLYVGSAFAQEGVAGRTARHLGGTGSRLWGADFLRGFADPVELWWTHHGEKVECTWARALAGMTVCSCPAPLVGASDCQRAPKAATAVEQKCPAHLFHTQEPPSIAAFAEQLGRSGSGGYKVHCTAAKHALAAAKGVKAKPSKRRSDPLNPFG